MRVNEGKGIGRGQSLTVRLSDESSPDFLYYAEVTTGESHENLMHMNMLTKPSIIDTFTFFSHKLEQLSAFQQHQPGHGSQLEAHLIVEPGQPSAQFTVQCVDMYQRRNELSMLVRKADDGYLKSYLADRLTAEKRVTAEQLA